MPEPFPVILLTRPEDASARLARQIEALPELREARLVVSPLLRIVFTGRLPAMDRVRGLIFTSANGVRGYERAGGPPRPAWAVGDATAQAARRIGLHTEAAEGDAGSLLRLLLARPPVGPLLHVRGEHARVPVAERLRAAGVDAEEVVLYRQIALPLNDAGQRALKGRAPVIVPLFSPRSAGLFAAQVAALPLSAPLYLAAMSPAVAAELAAVPARQLRVSSQADGAQMLACVKGLLDAAARLEGAGDGL